VCSVDLDSRRSLLCLFAVSPFRLVFPIGTEYRVLRWVAVLFEILIDFLPRDSGEGRRRAQARGGEALGGLSAGRSLWGRFGVRRG